MRIAATLLVLAAVLWLASRAGSGGLHAVAPGEPAASAPANAAQRAAGQISDAVSQGAARRASDAAAP